MPDERVVQALRAGPVPPDFVPCPALPEGLAAGGQLADQVRQGLVVGVAAGLGALRNTSFSDEELAAINSDAVDAGINLWAASSAE